MTHLLRIQLVIRAWSMAFSTQLQERLCTRPTGGIGLLDKNKFLKLCKAGLRMSYEILMMQKFGQSFVELPKKAFDKM